MSWWHLWRRKKLNDRSFEPEWVEDVDKKGELFYIETAPEEDNKSLTAPFEFKNGNIYNKSVIQNLSNKQESKIIKTKTDNLLEVCHQKLTFGERFNVYFTVNPRCTKYNSRTFTKCESLLGIIPCHFPKQHIELLTENLDEQQINSWIIIQGFLPDSEAIKSGDIKIGDWLQSINDLAVSFVNINAILSSIERPTKLKLTFVRPYYDIIKSKPFPDKQSQKNLIRIVNGGKGSSETQFQEKEPYLFLYLTKDISSENTTNKTDILYQFPNEASKLVSIRGMFLTLSQMICDVTNSDPISSTLLFDGHLIHVGYFGEERDLLIICLPACKFSLNQLQDIIQKIVRVLRLLYKSLSRAFMDTDNKSRLDEFFGLMFSHLMRTSFTCLQIATSTVHWLTLPDDIKITIDTALSDFEASDFADMSEDFLDLRRAYSVLGTSLFYKRFLIANHLPQEDLADIVQYLDLHGVLTLMHRRSVQQLVIWKEIFPTRRHSLLNAQTVGYTEPDGRCFLLVVGIKHSLLACLLEAGGCASLVEGHPGPDPFYIDQVQAVLLMLETANIPAKCESSIIGHHMPALASLNWFASSGKNKDEALLGIATLSHTSNKHTSTSSARKKHSPLPERHLVSPGSVTFACDVESDNESGHSIGTSEGSSLGLRDEKSQGSDESGNNGLTTNIFQSGKKKRNLPSVYNMANMKVTLDEEEDTSHFIKLVSGCDNTLFHYLHMDHGEGIYISPTEETLNLTKGNLQQQLMINFNAACLAIHEVFESSLKIQTQLKSESQHKFGINKALTGIKEHGILFQCLPEGTSEKKSQKYIHYWVVGRLMLEPDIQEFFVCFHDSTSQNAVELAFRLCFGLTI